MAIVCKKIDVNRPLSEGEKAMIRALKYSPIVYDEDSPEMSYEYMVKCLEYTRAIKKAKCSKS